MTFLFLDKVAGIVGAPDALIAEARERVLKDPKPRGTRDEIRAHVAATVVGVANDKLRQPLIDAVDAHAQETGDAYCMMTGEEPGSDGYRAAVIAAFDGNDCGIDMDALPHGGATPEAVADQVLVAPIGEVQIYAALNKAGVVDAMLDGIVDEILAPEYAPTEWSLRTLAFAINGNAAFADAVDAISEAASYILSDDTALRASGFQLVGITPTEELTAWLDERAMFSSPEQDEADVAKVLRLINQKGGGSHTGLDGSAAAADMTAAGAEHEQPAPAADPEWKHEALTGLEAAEAHARGMSTILARAREVVAPDGTVIKSNTQQPVAVEPSDVTRAVAAALKTLFEMTKESDTHVAEVLGVPKATVAQSRKDVTPWAPDADQMGRLRALVGRYNDALAAAAGALNALEGK